MIEKETVQCWFNSHACDMLQILHLCYNCTSSFLLFYWFLLVCNNADQNIDQFGCFVRISLLWAMESSCSQNRRAAWPAAGQLKTLRQLNCLLHLTKSILLLFDYLWFLFRFIIRLQAGVVILLTSLLSKMFLNTKASRSIASSPWMHGMLSEFSSSHYLPCFCILLSSSGMVLKGETSICRSGVVARVRSRESSDFFFMSRR